MLGEGRDGVRGGGFGRAKRRRRSYKKTRACQIVKTME